MTAGPAKPKCARGDGPALEPAGFAVCVVAAEVEAVVDGAGGGRIAEGTEGNEASGGAGAAGA